MKSIIKYFGALLLSGMMVAGISSCQNLDYPDRYKVAEGEPSIDFVRYADSDVIIEQAFMSDVVCLVGDNLRSVVELWFNDQQAILNTSYMTDHTILVTVPKNQAEVQTDKIYMVNKIGRKYEYPFKVLPPAPKVNAMSLEYALPGETVTIYGDYFIDLISVTFKNADPIPAANVSYTSGAITLTVPEGAMPGPVQVATASGTVNSVFHYQDHRGMLFNFDTGLMPNGWNVADIISNPADGISGNYVQFGNGVVELAADGSAWAEGSGGFSIPYWPGSWNDPEDYSSAPKLTDVADFSDFANMAIKFEMNIPASNPWKSNAMQIIPAPVTAVSMGNQTVDIFGVDVAGQNNTYYHELSLPRGIYAPFKATGSFDTDGKWITVTVPISEFVYDWDGETKATGELSVESFTSLLIFFHGIAGSACTPIVKVDNIRVVPCV